MANDQEPRAPQTVRELTQHLARTLVQHEVLEPMDKIGWAFGSPPSTGDPDNPASSEAPPASAPAPTGTTPAAPLTEATANTPPPATDEIDWESLKDPKTGLYMGKYTSPHEAAKGVGHAVNMAKDALARADRAEAALAAAQVGGAPYQTQPVVSPTTAPTVPAFNPASRADFDAANARLDAVLSSVAEDGGILDSEAAKQLKDSLREVVTLGARTVAEEVVVSRENARNADSAKWNAVDVYMTDKYPGSQNFADEMGLFVETQPLIKSAVEALVATGKEIQASELMWIEFSKARDNGTAAAALATAQNTEVRMEAADQVRREAVDEARRNAGVPSSSAGGVHESPDAGPSQSEIEQAAAGMRAYGSMPGNPHAARWRELTIGRNLPKDIFGPR